MYNNPYFNPQQRYQPMPTMNPQVSAQPYMPTVATPTPQISLLGKVVDSIEVVKAMDIPLDGSVSYFPLTDGTAIVSKQLQMDGTSKTVIYKPIKEEGNETMKFVTFEDMKKEINKIDLSDLEEEIKDLRSELKDIQKKLKSKGE